MSIVGNLGRRDMYAAVPVSDFRNPQNWLLSHGQNAARRVTSGVPVTAETALGLAGYYGAVRAISEDIAKLPVGVFRELKRGREKLPEHPMAALLRRRANPNMSAMAFRETLTHFALAWGNGVAVIERADSTGEPVALWPVHPSRVTIRSDPSTSMRGPVRYLVSGNQRDDFGIFEAEDVLHLHGLAWDGVHGYSILQAAAQSVGLGIAAEDFGASFFGNSTQLAGVLEHPGRLSPKSRVLLRDSWADMHAGVYKAYKPAILEEGMQWKQLGVPPEQAQLLDTRKFQVVEMARWFRMPPHKLQELGRATFKNLEAQNSEYVVDCLMPWIMRWEHEVNAKELQRDGDASVFLRHKVAGLLRGDQVQRSAFYKERFMIGSLSPNEVRAFEDENPVEGGDQYFVPMNMVPLDKAAEIAQAERRQTAQADPAPRGAGVNQPKRTGRAEALEAVGPVFSEALDRLGRREDKALKRARAKYKDDPAALTVWADEFYREHDKLIVEAIAPAVLALEALTGAGGLMARACVWVRANCDGRLRGQPGGGMAELVKALFDEESSDG